VTAASAVGVSLASRLPPSFLLPLADAIPFEAPQDSDWIAPWTVAFAIVFVALAVFSLAFWRWPLLMVRPILWLVTRTFYRLRVSGIENIPRTGPALIVCNHITYLDWLWLLAVSPRFIRFVIYAPYAQIWGVRTLLRWAKVIPIDASSGPRALVRSLHAASDALAAGELVGVFAEGGLTRTGFMLPFNRGFEQILKRTPAPIIPTCLDQVWGSIFSYHRGKVFWKWPQEYPYPVTIAFGAPLPPDRKAAEVRLVIQKLSADCAHERTKRRKPVHRQFVRMAARHPFRSCFVDPNGKPPVLNYARVLAAAMCLARQLRPVLRDEKMVGVWLPASIGGAVTNIALALLGKTSVNLNYTSSQDSLRYAIRECGIRHVLTARRFTAKMPWEVEGPDVIPLEEIAAKVTGWQKLCSYLAVVLLPGWFMEYCWLGLGRHALDDVATVIFSSGSTGEPKGVLLTHSNIAANAESMIQAVGLDKRDRALGVLPFFHSFGYTVTLWVPLQVGASVVYYPDPRQAKEIGELCRTLACTIYLSTPTFLRFCLRRCEPDDFKTLRILICGAEKMPRSLALEFQEKFGILPLEGYGCTELSPVAATNLPDQTIGGLKQVSNRPGTVGQPIPGVAAKVVDAETLTELPPGSEGLLLIYGPNVMKGYLHRPELTAKVIRDGWYVTGDVARIDEEGFITLTGRLSRFAKVGGEMVPLEKVEEELHLLLETTDKHFAVTSVPDERKGERVVVLHLPLNGKDARALAQGLSDKGLPNLWVPGERDFFPILEIPVLGSGKLDLKRVKELALDRALNGSA
jgi:acyl-[acyl-carrier-protein]-phospholipid O-acyltransferase / long-chain-fatty-acid--[acyl-carrier-protein] ligase